MDSYLSNFLSANRQITVVQPRNIYYKKYNTRLRLKNTESFNPAIRTFIRDVSDLPNFKIRTEGRKVSIFFEYSEELFGQLLFLLKDKKYQHGSDLLFKYFYELSIDSVNLNKNSLYSPRLKKQGFGYQLKIKTGVHVSPDEQKNLSTLIKNNPDQFNVPDSTMRWLNRRYTFSYTTKYFYVKDSSILTIVNLSCSNLIGQVAEII